MEFSQKINVLRDHERYCYQNAYYLLEDEQNAASAAQKALLDLMKQESFFAAAAENRKVMVKQAVIKRSLQIAKARCSVV